MWGGGGRYPIRESLLAVGLSALAPLFYSFVNLVFTNAKID